MRTNRTHRFLAHIAPVKSFMTLVAAAALLPAFAAVRYVDYTNGADSGDGSAAPGWKTLAYAVLTADPGDEIVLAKGRM